MRLVTTLLALCLAPAAVAQSGSLTPQYHVLPRLRAQARLQDGWTEERKRLIPGLMDKYGLDAWIVTQLEYAEDTLFRVLKPATAFSARRRTLTLYVAPSARGGPASYTWVDNSRHDLLRALVEALDRHAPLSPSSPLSSPFPPPPPSSSWSPAARPLRIGINTDPNVAFASGLHVGELDTILEGFWAFQREAYAEGLTAIDPMFAVELAGRQRFGVAEDSMAAETRAAADGTSQERLGAVRETKPTTRTASTTDREAWYKLMQETAWALVAEAFSAAVVTPGVTTPADVAWWMRDKMQALDYTTWFPPTVSVVDPGFFQVGEAKTESPDGAAAAQDKAVQCGDMLHVDFGLTGMGMNTDTQHLGYVLCDEDAAPTAGFTSATTRADADAHGTATSDAADLHNDGHGPDSRVPQGFVDGLATANRIQDIVLANMVPGRTGNEILRLSKAQMRDEAIDGAIYCHPIGPWGHSAGTLIGMSNLQDGVPVQGDFPLLNETWFSVELLAMHFVPERNATLVFPVEENVRWVPASDRNGGAGAFEWVYGQQTEFHLVNYASKEMGQVQQTAREHL